MTINLSLIRHLSCTYRRRLKIFKDLVELHLLVLTHTRFSDKLGADYHLLI